MKKFLAVVAGALLVALLLWGALRVQQAHRQVAVAELLPGTTLALAEAPDFNRTREQWHASDLYALWREPAVQAWLEKPLGQLPENKRGHETFAEFLRLRPTNGFLALTSLEQNEPKVIGGFHFEGGSGRARSFIEAREAPWLAQRGEAKRATLTYEGHQIETVKLAHFTFARVYDREWYFASNDLAALQALLDRADRRAGKTAGSLQDDAHFKSAQEHFGDDYAARFFIAIRPFMEKLAPLLAMTGQSGSNSLFQLKSMQSMESMSSTFGFAGGKMSETIFVEMPRQSPPVKLTRPALAAATTNTFFYSASLTQFSNLWQLPINQWTRSAFARDGITEQDLAEAFAGEMDLVGDWPPETRWPNLSATLPVKDAVRARKIVDALTSVPLAGASWTQTERDGVVYYSLPGFGGFVPLRPTLALSPQRLVAGSDATTVETQMAGKISAGNELEKSAPFREAVARVPAGDAGFHYLDPRLLLERADTALRPLLLLSATIYPALGNKIDAAKLPPIEAITKHLSPIVMSQHYTGNGYLSESIGPIAFREATGGLAVALAASYFHFWPESKAAAPARRPRAFRRRCRLQPSRK